MHAWLRRRTTSISQVVWSWDITKLMGPAKWSYFYLYVIIDIFSRRVVGWCVADKESATLFAALFEDATTKHPTPKRQLTLHADRGGPMRAKATALLLADLGVTKSHSRPHTSNDNPFSESHFKTMKYQPQFPQRFGCIQDAKTFCRGFFNWYNQDHHHAGIGLMTPDQVHYGQADQVHAARQITLDGAFRRNPERFVRKEEPPAKPIATWINPPSRQPTILATCAKIEGHFGVDGEGLRPDPAVDPLVANEGHVARRVKADSRRRRGPKGRLYRACHEAILGHQVE
jgi:putative transposase